MKKAITEANFPVEQNWLLKIPISFLFTTVIILVFLSVIFIPMIIFFSEIWLIFAFVMVIVACTMLGIGILSMIIAYFSRANFHYSLEDDFIVFHQGIITKQQKNLPYAVIQDLIIYRDIADRLFGLASLSIENASFGGGQVYGDGGIGFIGNAATIPGLKKQNAEALKSILLSKIKSHTSLDNKSGL